MKQRKKQWQIEADRRELLKYLGFCGSVLAASAIERRLRIATRIFNFMKGQVISTGEETNESFDNGYQLMEKPLIINIDAVRAYEGPEAEFTLYVLSRFAEARIPVALCIAPRNDEIEINEKHALSRGIRDAISTYSGLIEYVIFDSEGTVWSGNLEKRVQSVSMCQRLLSEALFLAHGKPKMYASLLSSVSDASRLAATG